MGEGWAVCRADFVFGRGAGRSALQRWTTWVAQERTEEERVDT